MMRKSNLLLAVIVLGSTAWVQPCTAEDLSAKAVLEDAKLYFSAPLRWDARHWMYFGGSVLAIGLAHQFDDNVRTHFAIGDRSVLNGKDPHSTRDALPAAALVAGTFAYAVLIDDDAGRVESYTMLEAAGLSAVTTTALKYAVARQRPNETADENAWRKSGDSFPSLHASAAFAIGTVFAESGGEEYRWVRRVIGYGVAGATAYTRVHDNVHWLSDTVAGAAIGIATAHFAMNRREARRGGGEVSVAPMQGGGVMLSFNMPLR